MKTFVAAGALIAALALARDLPAQASRDSTTISAGARYHAGALHRFFFGPHYRDLWTLPIRTELLDLRTYAGGLTPTTAGGRLQSRSLRFRAVDGRQFSFRLVDKNPINVLPEDLRETFAADIVQDQTSAGHPASSLVAGALLDAAGILHPDLRFMVLRDEPALGQFREEFAGKLGTFEPRILSPAPNTRGFAGATRIVDSDTLFAILARDARERVDDRVLLAARLMDLFLGDPDRHRGQWTWAKSGFEPGDPWLPIPEDRDLAFIRYDGAFLALARRYYPEVLNFSDRYGNLIGATRAGIELDRKLLSGLQWPVWDSVAAATKARLTDGAIEGAVARMPAEYLPLDSARLAATLKIRRDQIPAVARRFYSLLASEAQVHLRDVAENVDVQRLADGTVWLRVTSPADAGVLIDRRYLPAETRELQLFLNGGNDRVTVRGPGPRSITLRIIGGDGDDTIADSTGGTRIYDERGSNVATGKTTKIDARPWVAPVIPIGPKPKPRDFGSEWRGMPWLTYSSDYGVFTGFGASHFDYGFRKFPYASLVTAKAGYATRARALRFELDGDIRHLNSRGHTTFNARVSQLEILRFYEPGNESPVLGSNEFHKVRQEQATVHLAMAVPLGAHAEGGIGPALRYARTELSGLVGLRRPYGASGFGTHEGFGQVGGRAWLRVDARNRPRAATSGVNLAVEGSVYPSLWDVATTFGEMHGEVSAFVTARAPLEPTLAVRAGGKKIWGAYPFYEAAYIGGKGTVRGLPLQRYAGDASLFANAELRLFIAKIPLLIPADFGVFGLADAGRVFVGGESSSRWHTGVGGGFWLAYLGRGNTLSFAFARAEGRLAYYFGMGFGF